MDELNLPVGYFLEEKDVEGKDYIFLYKNGKAILMLPSEHCPSQKIQEVIQQTKD